MHLKTYFWEICSPQIHFGKINFEQKDTFGKYTFGNTHTRTYVFTHPRIHARTYAMRTTHAPTHTHVYARTHIHIHINACSHSLTRKTTATQYVHLQLGENLEETFFPLIMCWWYFQEKDHHILKWNADKNLVILQMEAVHEMKQESVWLQMLLISSKGKVQLLDGSTFYTCWSIFDKD